MEQILLITAYKEFDYLYRFSKFCSEQGLGVYIHIDKKYSERTILDKLNTLDNVSAVSIFKVPWGGYQHIEAICYMLKLAIGEHSECKYLHVITGQDCICRNIKEFKSFFSKNHNCNYMSISDGENNRFRYETFYRNDWINYKNSIGKFITKTGYVVQRYLFRIRRRPPEGFKIYKGMVYVSITSEFGKYVLNFLRTENGKQYLRWLKWCLIPEEFFFQTILMNSPFKETACKNNLRYALWKKKHGAQPGILDSSDYDTIVNSGAFFARKISDLISKELLNKLTQRVTGGYNGD